VIGAGPDPVAIQQGSLSTKIQANEGSAHILADIATMFLKANGLGTSVGGVRVRPHEVLPKSSQPSQGSPDRELGVGNET
jgi:hypothetical protein